MKSKQIVVTLWKLHYKYREQRPGRIGSMVVNCISHFFNYCDKILDESKLRKDLLGLTEKTESVLTRKA